MPAGNKGVVLKPKSVGWQLLEWEDRNNASPPEVRKWMHYNIGLRKEKPSL